MKKWTVLKFYFLIYIVGCFILTLVNWEILSYKEGWGIVYMVGLIAIGLIGLLFDFILALIFKNKKLLNGIGIIIAIGFSIFLFIELKNNMFN